MKYLTVIIVCVALSVTYALAIADEHAQSGSAASTQESTPLGDELHFVSVLTFEGEIVALEPAKRLVGSRIRMESS